MYPFDETSKNHRGKEWRSFQETYKTRLERLGSNQYLLKKYFNTYISIIFIHVTKIKSRICV